MLTEKERKCCQEAASHYLNGNVRVGSRIFAPSKLEIFVPNDSRLPDASDCHKRLHGRCHNFRVQPLRATRGIDMFDLVCLFKVSIYRFAQYIITKTVHYNYITINKFE